MAKVFLVAFLHIQEFMFKLVMKSNALDGMAKLAYVNHFMHF
jgi:hypothetical protein